MIIQICGVTGVQTCAGPIVVSNSICGAAAGVGAADEALHAMHAAHDARIEDSPNDRLRVDFANRAVDETEKFLQWTLKSCSRTSTRRSSRRRCPWTSSGRRCSCSRRCTTTRACAYAAGVVFLDWRPHPVSWS